MQNKEKKRCTLFIVISRTVKKEMWTSKLRGINQVKEFQWRINSIYSFGKGEKLCRTRTLTFICGSKSAKHPYCKNQKILFYISSRLCQNKTKKSFVHLQFKDNFVISRNLVSFKNFKT